MQLGYDQGEESRDKITRCGSGGWGGVGGGGGGGEGWRGRGKEA